jgi:hypothetical protein
MLPFDPSALAPQLAAMQQRERMLAELRRLDDQGGATDDNKAEIKKLKKLLDEQRKQLAEQKKDQAKQKEIQNLLYEVLTELKDLDQRLKNDDQFEAAEKAFIDLYKRTNFEWILDHKNYDSLDFKELANKTGELYGALIKIPKLKIQIEEVESWLQHEAEEKAKKAAAEKKKSEVIRKREEEIRSKRIAENRAREAKNRAREAKKDAVLEKQHKKEKTVRRVIHYPLWLCATIVVEIHVQGLFHGRGPEALFPMLLFGWIPCWVIAYFLSENLLGALDAARASEWASFSKFSFWILVVLSLIVACSVVAIG